MDWTQAFVSTETTKLYLDEAKRFWILVKNELSVAEDRAIAVASLKGVSRAAIDLESHEERDHQLVELDMAGGSFRKIVAWLVDWNVPDAKGKTIDISTPVKKLDAVKNLKPAHYRAIELAIDAHAASQDQEKKAPSGSETPAPISS